MAEAVFMFLALIFIVCGMYFVCRLIYNIYVSSKYDLGYYVVIVGNGDDSKLSQRVYSAFVQMNLMNFSKRNEIIVLDLGVSEKTKRECYEALDGKGRVLFVDEKTLAYFFVERENKL